MRYSKTSWQFLSSVDKNTTFYHNRAVDLKDFIKALQKNLKVSAIFSLILSSAVFVLSSQLPSKFKASASIYIKRQVETESKNFFTYEGYYGAQTAEKYADTVVGLLKSVDIRKQALERLNITPTPQELTRLERSTIVKRTGPQLVLLSVNAPSRKYAQDTWLSLAESVIGRSRALNEGGDNKLSIDLVEPTPVISEVRPIPVLYALAAFIGGFLIAMFGIAFGEYMR